MERKDFLRGVFKGFCNRITKKVIENSDCGFVLNAKEWDLINGHGIPEEFYPKNVQDGYTLDELYKKLNCELIEVVHITDEIIFVIDEEGALKDDREINIYASVLLNYKMFLDGVIAEFPKLNENRRIVFTSPIYGKVLITHTKNLK